METKLNYWRTTHSLRKHSWRWIFTLCNWVHCHPNTFAFNWINLIIGLKFLIYSFYTIYTKLLNKDQYSFPFHLNILNYSDPQELKNYNHKNVKATICYCFRLLGCGITAQRFSKIPADIITTIIAEFSRRICYCMLIGEL